MNAAHGYAASRSRHRHFCCRCCSAAPSRRSHSRRRGARAAAATSSRPTLLCQLEQLASRPVDVGAPSPHLRCDSAHTRRLSGLDPLGGSGRAFPPGRPSGGRRTLDLFTRSPGLASRVAANSSARSSTCAALMTSDAASMVRRMSPVQWAEVGVGESNATSDSVGSRQIARRGPLEQTCKKPV